MMAKIKANMGQFATEAHERIDQDRAFAVSYRLRACALLRAMDNAAAYTSVLGEVAAPLELATVFRVHHGDLLRDVETQCGKAEFRPCKRETRETIEAAWGGQMDRVRQAIRTMYWPAGQFVRPRLRCEVGD